MLVFPPLCMCLKKMGSMSPEGVEEPPIQVPTESGHICVVEFLQILLKEV